MKIYYLEKNKTPFYIGKTKSTLKVRLNNHLHKDKNTTIHLIENVPNEEWKFWEGYWIEQFKSWGFNLNNKNNGGGGVSQHSVYTKDIMSNIHKGKKKPFNESHRINHKNAYKGRKVTWGDKISEGLKNREITWRDKISKNSINKNGKPVTQYTLEGLKINEFPSCAEASDFLFNHRKGSGVRDCARGKQKTAYGYIWKFI